LTVQDVLKFPVPPADHRIPYGEDPLQFGDLRLPEGNSPYPVVLVIHGGCWRAKYNLDHISIFCAALTQAGVATWSLEYRRVGNPGGGWPGTFQDVSKGTDHLREIAQKYSLDLNRVVAVGHSAGGHLALWLAGRKNLPTGSTLYTPDPLPIKGVVSLAGVVDLRKGEALGACDDALIQLAGGSSKDVPDHYKQVSPIELLPIGVPQRLIVGANDKVMLEINRNDEIVAKKTKEDMQLVILEGAGHFELIAPQSFAWSTVKEAVLSLLRSGNSQ
jgi:acetyl esterase/lipase